MAEVNINFEAKNASTLKAYDEIIAKQKQYAADVKAMINAEKGRPQNAAVSKQELKDLQEKLKLLRQIKDVQMQQRFDSYRSTLSFPDREKAWDRWDRMQDRLQTQRQDEDKRLREASRFITASGQTGGAGGGFAGAAVSGGSGVGSSFAKAGGSLLKGGMKAAGAIAGVMGVASLLSNSYEKAMERDTEIQLANATTKGLYERTSGAISRGYMFEDLHNSVVAKKYADELLKNTPQEEWASQLDPTVWKQEAKPGKDGTPRFSLIETPAQKAIKEFEEEIPDDSWTWLGRTLVAPKVKNAVALSASIKDGTGYNKTAQDAFIYDKKQEFKRQREAQDEASIASTGLSLRDRQAIAEKAFSEIGVSANDAMKTINQVIHAMPDIQNIIPESLKVAQYAKLGFSTDEVTSLGAFYEQGDKNTASQIFSMLNNSFLKQDESYASLRKYMQQFNQLVGTVYQTRAVYTGQESYDTIALMKGVEEGFQRLGGGLENNAFTGKFVAESIQQADQAFKGTGNDYMEALRYQANMQSFESGEAMKNPAFAKAYEALKRAGGGDNPILINEIMKELGVQNYGGVNQFLANTQEQLGSNSLFMLKDLFGGVSRASLVGARLAEGDSDIFSPASVDRQILNPDVYASELQKLNAQKDNLMADLGGTVADLIEKFVGSIVDLIQSNARLIGSIDMLNGNLE